MRTRPTRRTAPPKKRGLVIPVSTGGSGAGLTMYEAILECPRRWWLDRELRKQNLPTSSDNEHTMMGTAAHGLLSKYYDKRKRFDTSHVVYKDISGGEWGPPVRSMQRAQRLVRHYMTKFPPSEFQVTAIEQAYKAPDVDWKPKGLNLTAQLDLEIKVNVAQAKKMLVGRRLLLQPGYYIVDHKCHSSNRSDLNDRHVLSLQQEGYGLIYEAVHPRRKLQGRLINMLIEGGTPKYRTLFLPPPDDASRERIYNMLMLAKDFMEREPPPAFSTACINKWGHICSHYLAGRCLRY